MSAAIALKSSIEV